MPQKGGTYTFLRESYQYWTGRFMPFMFVWSTLLVTPLIMATGMIGMTDYLRYFAGFYYHGRPLDRGRFHRAHRRIAVPANRLDSPADEHSLGRYDRHCDCGNCRRLHALQRASDRWPLQAGAFILNVHFFRGLGLGLVLAVYDYFGYYTITYVGERFGIQERSCIVSIILSILGVLIIDLTMNIGIIGVVPWQQAEKSISIGTDFMQRVWGTPGASVLSILIIWTAFASVYTGLLGASRLPFNAAREKLFFKPFGWLHPRLHFPYIALLVMGLVTAIGCFLSLATVINALIALTLWSQFIAQIVALTILRHKQPDLVRPYKQWLYPVPSILAAGGFIYVFLASGWSAIRVMLAWTVLGIIAFLIRARIEHVWPFGPKKIREEFVGPQAAARQSEA